MNNTLKKAAINVILVGCKGTKEFCCSTPGRRICYLGVIPFSCVGIVTRHRRFRLKTYPLVFR